MTKLLLLFALSADAALPTAHESVDVSLEERVPVDEAAAAEARAWVASLEDEEARPVRRFFERIAHMFGLERDEAPVPSEEPDVRVAEVEVPAEEPEAFGPLKVFAGYEQDWHAVHDELFQRIVAEFNAEKGWDEGDDHWLDANLVKAWALQESGGHRRIFTSGDMMQMNNRGDWAPEKEWFGVRLGQELTPEQSLRAALDWAYYKGEETRRMRGARPAQGWHATLRGTKPFEGYESRFVGWNRALKRYNGGGVADYLGDIQRKIRHARG